MVLWSFLTIQEGGHPQCQSAIANYPEHGKDECGNLQIFGDEIFKEKVLYRKNPPRYFDRDY
jgi:hypothetical protein